MKWYWKIGGGHTHVRVFMNGAKCGDLCFRNEEFYAIRHSIAGITFIDENDPEKIAKREEAWSDLDNTLADREAYMRTDNTPK